MTEGEQQRLENERMQNELAYAYKRFANTEDGKAILVDLTNFCGQNRTSVCEQQPDQYQTFFAEGKRRVYLHINSLINREIKENEE